MCDLLSVKRTWVMVNARRYQGGIACNWQGLGWRESTARADQEEKNNTSQTPNTSGRNAVSLLFLERELSHCT